MPVPAQDPTDADLARAAQALKAELDKQTRTFRRLRDPMFTRTAAIDPAMLALADQVAADAVFVGDFTTVVAPGVVLRAGVLRDGFTLIVVVGPADRAPYVELTTFLARPPRPEREVVTTNGRADPSPPRPPSVRLEQRPELAPVDLRRRHLERLAVLKDLPPGDDHPVRLGIEPTEAGVLRAMRDYLRALSGS
jgi:hypothetical protein